jgi:hypothetical protein
MKKIIALCVASALLGGAVGFGVGRTARPSREQVVSYLSGLNAGELADLIKGLAQQWGVSSTPPDIHEMRR